jgi:integrase
MMGHRNVCDTVVEWGDTEPLVFNLTEEAGPPNARYATSLEVNLNELLAGFTASFLLNLRDYVIDLRLRVNLNTVANYSRNLKKLFSRAIELRLWEGKIDVIDSRFLLAVNSAKDQFTEFQLYCLKSAFAVSPYSALWCPGLHASDFPSVQEKKGTYGKQIDRILVTAMSRAACVHVLSRCEQAYGMGQMNIGHFAFANLAFAVFCRPESYRQIRLSDLIFDTKSNAYFLHITPAKTGVRHPAKLCYRLNEPVGLLLQKQRQHVVEKYGHLVGAENIGKLCLFPARKLRADKSGWLHAYANLHFGMYKNPVAFVCAYPREIRRVFLQTNATLGANALRHTVGTQLAQTGAAARTIQAVLKHATDSVCRAYVDIAFHGLVDVLSDAMLPAFDKHLPAFERFRSKWDPIAVAQAIRSDDPTTGKLELTGECGKLIQCEFAPISCYGCSRFIPCWDADHAVNLTIVQQEIDEYKGRGKPFQHMVERALAAKYQIIMVMNAVERYRQGLASGPLA